MTMRHNVFLKYLLLFFLGGFMYGAVEIICRGFSHISMFVAGGLCFIGIGSINEILPRDTSLILQMFLGSMIVTSIEFVIGLIVNVWLRLGVWDYSMLRYNIMGQVSFLFSIYWFFLSLPAIWLDDILRYWMFGQEKPMYKI